MEAIAQKKFVMGWQRWMSLLIGIVIGSFSFSAFLGWHFQTEWILSHAVSMSIMNYNNAVLFSLSAVALGLTALGYKRAATFMAAMIIVAALSLITEAVFDENVTLNDFIFNPYLPDEEFNNPRLIYSSACFILYALALLFVMYRKLNIAHIWVPGIIVTIIAIICLGGVFGYGYSYASSDVIFMTQYTAGGIFLLCLGIVLVGTATIREASPHSIQLWTSILVCAAVFLVIVAIYFAASFEQRKYTLHLIKTESAALYENIAVRVSIVVFATAHSAERYIASKSNFNDVWDTDSKAFMEALPGLQTMFILENQATVVKHSDRPGFAFDKVLPSVLGLSNTFSSFRTTDGTKILVIQYPIDKQQSVVWLFNVDQLITAPKAAPLLSKFDTLIVFDGVMLSDTFSNNKYEKGRSYNPFYYESKLSKGILRAYMWPRNIIENKYQGILPAAILIIGGLLANFIGFLFYLIQRYKKQSHELNIANTSQGAFFANVSHEMRTPLHGIIGTTSMMRNLALPDKEQRYMQIIGASARRLLTMINNLIALTRLESKMYSFAPQKCDVKDLAQSVISSLAIKAVEKKVQIRFTFDQDPDIKGVRIPTHAFTEVLVNLLSNAIKFTDQGWIHVRIDISQEKGQGSLNLTVQDTGIGVAPQRRNILTENKKRVGVDADITRGGAGFGLFLVTKIIQELKGKIWFESTLGKGSTFFVHIPVEISNEY